MGVFIGSPFAALGGQEGSGNRKASSVIELSGVRSAEVRAQSKINGLDVRSHTAKQFTLFYPK